MNDNKIHCGNDRIMHGHSSPVPIDALLADDPDLWLVNRRLRAWSDAHPCECEALCDVRPSRLTGPRCSADALTSIRSSALLTAQVS